ncbi:universal stress protein [Bradyrhizobium sp. CCBAU 51765]|uniref:universal stress protein n=1 Tax=Bradyrhizobium sp. CCBAU 51765 TaxID=1325102 RepID=UPI001888083A|nr:universal stress protein [Bradyrhizobium sp. CCBAU 51765]QOZ06688.1 universal stress protein [Bradyrhizobium sp. CCBAU 51765]
MPIKDILLTLTSYPEPTPVSIIGDAVAFASLFGAHIAAIACEARVEIPGTFLSSSLVDVAGIAAAEARKSLKNAEDLLASFESAAEKAGLIHEKILERCVTYKVSDTFVEYARLRDLTIVSVPESYDQWYAEAVIFGSGKPTLVLPERPRTKSFELNTVVVAWDFSRTAARAIADAMSVLEKAKRVRVVTVFNEKALGTTHSAEEVAKNLSRHGVDVTVDKVDAAARPIGEVLESHVASCGADVLVMGAYGQSRLREFILGGATRSLLARPPLPILFSH